MNGKVRHIDYTPDEYISGVGGVLRADEQGVYWMVCTLIMSEGGPIQFDDRRIAGLCRIRPAEARRIIEKLVQMRKINLNDGQLSQKRAQSEVERSANRIQIASENGAKGGRPSKKDQQNQAEAKAAGYSGEKLTTNHKPQTEEDVSTETSDLRTKPARRRHSYSAKFSEFWASYPTDELMSKAAAGKAFDALSDEDQDAAITSVPAFKVYCSSHPDYRPVHAVRYLTQGRFDGFNQAAAKVNTREFVKVGTTTWEAIRLKRGVVTMMHKEHRGDRGWWFDKAEIAEALQRLAA